MRFENFTLLWILALSFFATRALADLLHEGREVSCLYDLNVDFMYLGEAKNLSRNKAVADQGAPLTDSSENRYSTFGLKDAAFNMQWVMPRGVGFEMVLRPDSTLSASPSTGADSVRELDLRSGRVVEPMPTVHLLDEYRLIVRRSRIEGRLGVERSSLESFRVTPELLGFGMRVRGPEKSFAATLASAAAHTRPMMTDSDSKFGGGLSVLSGRSDRHDARLSDTSGIGESPAKQDPYWGGAASFFLNLTAENVAGIGYSLIEERQGDGHTRLNWYQIGLKQRIALKDDLVGLVGLEMRQLHQTYQMEGTDISDVLLSSAGLTASLPIVTGQDALIGLWLGRGALHPQGVMSQSTGSSSYQAELGWRWQVEEQLEFCTYLSREWRRDGTDNGGSVGGFSRGSSTQSTQSRFALQIQYKLGGQIF